MSVIDFSSNFIFSHIISMMDLPNKIKCNLINKHCALLVEKSVKTAYNNHRLSEIFSNEVVNYLLNFMDISNKLTFRLVCKNFDMWVINKKEIIEHVGTLFDSCVNKHKENQATKEKILEKQLQLSNQLDKIKQTQENWKKDIYTLDDYGNGFDFNGPQNIFTRQQEASQKIDSINNEKDQLTTDLKINREEIKKSYKQCITAYHLFKKLKR